MAAIFLAVVHITYMYFHHRNGNGTNAVLQRNAGMGVRTGVQHDAVVGESHLLQLVDEFAFHIALIVFNVCIGTIQGFGMDSYRLAVEALKGIDRNS